MEPSEWVAFFNALAGMDALIDRVTDPRGKPVFLIGSALSSSDRPEAPGVPGVDGMLALVENRVRRDGLDVSEYHQQLDLARGAGARYGAAFRFLSDRRGPGAVNEVIQTAVLRARSPRAAGEAGRWAALEEDTDGWVLPRGTAALGELLAKFPVRYPGPTLTTNFDPLLAVAVRKAGGHPHRTVLDGDGALPSPAEAAPEFQEIVSLHGCWRDSDTHHLDIELTAPRPRLDASLGRLLDGRLVVVVGDGGWEDAFMKTVCRLLDDGGARPDIVWALHENEAGDLFAHHGALLDRFDKWRYRRRF